MRLVWIPPDLFSGNYLDLLGGTAAAGSGMDAACTHQGQFGDMILREAAALASGFDTIPSMINQIALGGCEMCFIKG